MLAIVIFIIILGVLIFVHELGHFTVARRNGIKAEEFGFGFPPRILGYFKNEKTGRYDFVKGSREIESKNTLYSLNWIPLGGFVKIKGENGENGKDPDSFAGKPAWVRTKVLAAGVAMNFILAWVLISIVFMIGAPEAVDSAAGYPNAKIQISNVVDQSPASNAGLSIGDEILKTQTDSSGKEVTLNDIKAVQEYINSGKGHQINLAVNRGGETLDLKVTPRVNAPEGQGALGIELTETAVVKYPWYEAVWKGLTTTLSLTGAIFVALWNIIASLFAGKGVGQDVAGPIGIAVVTKQVTGLGLVYILQFAALLSVNLGIINILPIPALDGGRILFIAIEKIKGSPVSQKMEQSFHTVGFVLLILLLILISFRDVLKLIG